MTDLEGLFDAAVAAAEASPNRSRKTGAAILTRAGVLVTGCNTFPDGIEDREERHAGEARYDWIEHAERMAIFDAARRGLALDGAAMAVSWFPCKDCARAIVACSVGTLVCREPDLSDPRWGPGFVTARAMLEEKGVRLVFVEDAPVPRIP